MSTKMKLLLIFMISFSYSLRGFASEPKTPTKAKKLQLSTSFSSPRDLASTLSDSNVKIKNSGADSQIVYGLYVRQFSSVATGQACSSATTMYASSENSSAGAFVMPVTIDSNAEASMGANYLYNMIYNAIYYLRIIVPMSPPGCALPGCTWGSDTTSYDWCIYIGAMAPVSVSGGYTSKIVPSAMPVSGAGFDYNLITSFEYIGPISCDDQELKCSVSSSQTQSF